METNNNIDRLFQQAREQQPEASFSETKEAFETSLKNGGNAASKNGKASVINLKNGLIMFSVISAILVTAVLLMQSPNETPNQVSNDVIVIDTVTTTLAAVPSYEDEIHVITTPEVKLLELNLPVGQLELEFVPRPTDWKDPTLKSKTSSDTRTEAVVSLEDTLYVFPKLSLEQQEENHKQKKKMLKQLVKLSKSHYAAIPAGTFSSDDKSISVQGFHMQTMEVTILEYRTFLFDLLIQGRKDEFLIAKPDQSRWTHINGNYVQSMEPMEEHYFSHAAYNNYPVNNVSRAGALMYCKWLTEEARQFDDKAASMNDVRLPSYYEWKYAATGGVDKSVYPWGGPYIRNAKWCYLANYWTPSDSVPIKYVEGDTTQPIHHGPLDGGFHTVEVSSYIPNDFGLYNMSGNVAEMVTYMPGEITAQTIADAQGEQVGALGGGWFSPQWHLEINSSDPYLGVIDPNVNIGFRVVVP